MEHGAVGLPHELLAALPEELRALLAGVSTEEGLQALLAQHPELQAALEEAAREAGVSTGPDMQRVLFIHAPAPIARMGKTATPVIIPEDRGWGGIYVCENFYRNFRL